MIEEAFDYFKNHAETDDIDAAIDHLGENKYKCGSRVDDVAGARPVRLGDE